MIKKLVALTLVVALAGTTHAATWTWTGGAETSDWYGAGNWSTDGLTYTNNPTEQYVGVASSSLPNYRYLNSDVTAINISGATVLKTVDDATTRLTSNFLITGGDNPIITLSDNAALTIGGGFYLADNRSPSNLGPSGTIDVTSGSTLNVTGTSYFGLYSGDGTVTASGGSTLNLAAAYVGYRGGAGGELTVSDGSTLNLTGSSYVGYLEGSSGELTISGGSTANVARLDIGFSGSTGVATFTGAGTTVNATAVTRVGNANGSAGPVSTGTLHIEAGAKLTTPEVYVGVWNAAIGTMNVTGAGSEVITSLRVRAGDSGPGTINVGSGGKITTPTLEIGRYATGSGTVNINSGGTINAARVTMGDGSTSSTASLLTFDNGTLKATGNRNDFIANYNTNPSAPSRVYVKSGGATIDSNGFNIVSKLAFEEDALSTGGGLTKNSAGQLVLASGLNTYTGETTVNAGTLVAYTDTSNTVDFGPIIVAAGATLVPAKWDMTNNVISSDTAVALRTSDLTMADTSAATFVISQTGGVLNNIQVSGALTAAGGNATVVTDFIGNIPWSNTYQIVGYGSTSGTITFMPKFDGIGALGLDIVDDGISSVSAVFGAMNQWNTAGPDNNYGTSGNWSLHVPNTSARRAMFAGTGETVTLNINATVSSLNFDGEGYLIQASGVNKFTMNSTIAFDAHINNVSGENTISAPIDLAEDTRVTVFPEELTPSILTLSGAIGGTGNVEKVGGGTLVLSSESSTFSGAIDVAAGTLEVGAAGALGTGTALNMASGTTLRYSGATSGSSSRGLAVAGTVTTVVDEAAAGLTLTGPVTSVGTTLNKQGAGTLALNNSAAGTVAFTALNITDRGTLALGGVAGTNYTIANQVILGSGSQPAESVPVVGGSLHVTGDASVVVNANTVLGIWNYSEGHVRVSDNGTFQANTFYAGDNSVGDSTAPAPGLGTVTLEDYATMNVASFRLGQFAYGEGHATLSGNAVLNVSGYSEFGLYSGTASLTMSGDSIYNGRDGRIGGLGLQGGYTNRPQVDIELNDNAKIVYSSFLNLGENNADCTVTLNDNASITANSVDFGWGANTNSTGILNGTSSITLNAGINLARSGANAQGSLTLNDQSKVTAGGGFLMAYAGTTDARALATLTVGEDAEFAVTGQADFGRSYGNATVNIAGTVKTGRTNFGNTNADATVTMTGSGSLAATGAIALGQLSNTNVTVTMTGDTSMSATTWIAVGNNYEGTGTAEMFMSGNASVTAGTRLEVAYGGTGTLHIGDGTLTDNAVFTSTQPLVLGWGNIRTIDGDPVTYVPVPTDATININGGGTLVTAGIITGADVVEGVTIDFQSSVLNINGGTLKANANNDDFITNAGGALAFQTNILAGGAKIDTDGYNIAINAPLTQDALSTGGGLAKLGEGRLTLGGTNTYTGGTTVEAGALYVGGSISSDVVVDAGAALMGSGTITGNVDLNGIFAVEFDGDTDTIDLLTVTGALDLTGGSFSFANIGESSIALGTYVFATYSSLTGNPISSVGIPGDWWIDYAYDYDGGTDNALALVVTSIIQPTLIPGDADGDLKVDAVDAKRLAENWGATSLNPGYTTMWEMGDFNGDGRIDAKDASILAAQWGDYTTPAESQGTAVPEPGMFALLLGLALAGLARRVRR